MQHAVTKAAWTTILVLLLAATAVAQPGGQGPELGAQAAGDPVSPPRGASDSPRSNQRSRPIDQLRVDIAQPQGEVLPPDHSSRLFSRGMVDSTAEPGHEPADVFMWAPTDLCYWPLYFEDVQLERYGQTLAPSFQPVFSGVHFAADFTLLPLKMVFDRPLSCMCTLGYHRPGSRVPCCKRDLLPISRSRVTKPARRSARVPSTQLARLPAAGSL